MKKSFTFSMLIMLCLLPMFAYGATITVSNTNDSGAGSLRQAISDAVAGDTIDFSTTGTITLISGQLTINKNLIINGPGAASLAISGNNSYRVFQIVASTVTMSDFTIRDGRVNDDGCGILNNSGTVTLNRVIITYNTVSGSYYGGGIYNSYGSITINDSIISYNTAGAMGGGIASNGSVTINNCTIEQNTAGAGGGLANFGFMTVISSTLNNNTASTTGWYGGGGAFNNSYLEMTNVTISGNSAEIGGGIANHGNQVILTNVTINGNTGGGIYNQYTTQLRNTIIANSISGNNCSGSSSVTSNGHNISSDSSCNLAGTNDQNSTNPMLGVLQNNGGPTQTHALLNGSPAIDTADPNNFPSTDQRGVSRPQGAGPDIGAFELEQQPVSVSVPSVTYYGMIIFVILAGSGAVYYLRRQRVS